jgi:D-alanyl-D-alanine carboxypeptidase/D-alanyl-D-alanine-endopeptidase (penicillin-binding protein 4)
LSLRSPALAAAALLACLPCAALPPDPLPEPVQAALARARVAAANAAFEVVPLDGGSLQLAHREAAPMSPASTMKLVTTYVALGKLGPEFRWRTGVFASREPAGGRLDGDLILRGDGDPTLVIERWWLLVQRVRALGVREIRGDLVIDRSRFAPGAEAAALVDHQDLRPYNAAPDALLINFKALSLDFVPDAAAGVARIVATPQLEGMRIPSQVPLSAGACGDWKGRLRADFSSAWAPRFHGSYTATCSVRSWHLNLLTPDEYALASFRALWRQAGGTFHGKVRDGRVAERDVHLFDQESPPLAEVIRDINKNSNNVMARQLYLALGAPQPQEEPAAPAQEVRPDADPDPADSPPTASDSAEDSRPLEEKGAQSAVAGRQPGEGAESTARSEQAVRAWLAAQDLAMPELVLQNGSGLSRQERISARSLARLLARAWSGNDMPAFLASLPLAGVDGTMKRRKAAEHAAYVKTGYLSEVRSLAGYVFAASGHRYAIVCLINDPHAGDAEGAVDGFLQWVWEKG